MLLFLFIWTGLIVFVWQKKYIRWIFLSVTGLSFLFLILPERKFPPEEELKKDYIQHLMTYQGTTYYWGGENSLGIDCSGLVRRALVNSLFCKGFFSFNSGLVREGIVLWWFDTSASELGKGAGKTQNILTVSNLNEFDHKLIEIGDLAVTTSGKHVMAYIGNKSWIEADPNTKDVTILIVGSDDSFWLEVPMNIVRWKILSK